LFWRLNLFLLGQRIVFLEQHTKKNVTSADVALPRKRTRAVELTVVGDRTILAQSPTSQKSLPLENVRGVVRPLLQLHQETPTAPVVLKLHNVKWIRIVQGLKDAVRMDVEFFYAEMPFIGTPLESVKLA
jgi:hypothetical protein